MPAPPFLVRAPRRRRWGLAGLLLFALAARGGPPFVTDDPEPVDFQHWEVYLASQYVHNGAGGFGTLPHVEVNYGALPGLQLHLIAPRAFDATDASARHTGYGDTELGVKYRFIEETSRHPQIGIFPLAELPTGDAAKNLGSGHTQFFLPVWLQKSAGNWTVYGGGGYWVNPGTGNRNWWFAGVTVQRQLLPPLALGLEIYQETASTRSGRPNAATHVGVIWDLNETCHLLASAGPNLTGPAGYQTYAAFQLTFGPKH